MTADHRRLVLMIPWAFVCVATTAQGVFAQTGAPEPGVSPIEGALIEYRCNALRSPVDSFESHSQCLSQHLASLRADFGYDLERLSASERKKIDARCRPNRPEGRDAYLGCLDVSLRAVHDEWITVNPPAAIESTSTTVLPPPEATVQASQRPGTRSRRAIGFASGSVGALCLAAGGAFLLRRRSLVRVRSCQVCSVAVPSGDLCPLCRHQAAVAVRHAAAEQAADQRAKRDDGQASTPRHEPEAASPPTHRAEGRPPRGFRETVIDLQNGTR